MSVLNVYTKGHNIESHPTYQEVTLAIKRLKNNKSPRSDGIPAEYLKAYSFAKGLVRRRTTS